MLPVPQRKHYHLLWLLLQQNYFQCGGWGGTTQAKAAALLQASLSTKVLVSGLEPCLEDKQTESWQRSREGLDKHLLEGGKPPNNRDINYSVMSVE